MKYINLGIKKYKEVLEFQEDLFNKKVKLKLKGESPENHLIFCEHPHVYTLGKSGNKSNLLANQDFLDKIGAEFYKVGRGGDITYHGPGQIVAYPILDLDQFNLGIRNYIYTIEEIIIDFLTEFGITGGHKSGATGVWLDIGTKKERKICAIGVKISRGISMHGFALNVNTDLKYFDYINPCGFKDKGVCSVYSETGIKHDIEEVKVILRKKIEKILNKKES